MSVDETSLIAATLLLCLLMSEALALRELKYIVCSFSPRTLSSRLHEDKNKINSQAVVVWLVTS